MASNIVAKIHWDYDIQLQEINEIGFIGNLNNNHDANYIKWSSDNQFIVLNLMDKLIVFETNIHSVQEKLLFVNDSIGKNLNFRSTDIKPVKDFQLKIIDDKKEMQRQKQKAKFPLFPPQVEPRFVDFEFGPLEFSKSYHLLSSLTDQNNLLIYLNIVPLKWNVICNISKLFNEFYLKKLNKIPLGEKEDYFDRLDRIRISAFAWHPQVEYQNTQQTEVHYYMYFATRSGSLYFIKIIFDDKLTGGNIEIIKSVETDLKIISTLRIFEKILLAQSIDGRIMLFNLELSQKVFLWSEIDNRPSYNFSFNQNGNFVEILFSKYRSISVVHVDVNSLSIDEFKEISIHRAPDDIETFIYEDIFAVFNLNTYYCFTTLSDDIYTFQRANSNKQTTTMNVDIDYHDQNINEKIFLRKLIVPNHKKNDDVHYVCVAPSSNYALVAILCRQCRFSGRLSNFKPENVYLYLGTMLDPPSATMSLTKRLLSSNSHNLADLLYLFRYNLFRKEYSQAQLDVMVDVLLRQVPLWLNRNLEETIECLQRMKFIRYLSRYCLVDGGKCLSNENQRDLLRKLMEKMNFLILKNYFRIILRDFIPISHNQPNVKKSSGLEQLTIEHLVSIYNLTTVDVIDFLPEIFTKEVFQLVEQNGANIDSFKSIRKDSFINSNSKSLKTILNRCPFCHCDVEDPSSLYLNHQYHLKCGHQIDVDSNSCLIMDPLIYSIGICLKCYESKLLLSVDEENACLWPDPRIGPWFKMSSQTCFFCL